jgi:hypothetical protein
MTVVYTYSEARENLAALLNRAAADGEVRIKRRDGAVFVVRPESVTTSPLDVAGVDLDLTAEEIVQFITEGRKAY